MPFLDPRTGIVVQQISRVRLAMINVSLAMIGGRDHQH